MHGTHPGKGVLQDTGSTAVYPLSSIKIDPNKLLADLSRMEEGLWVIQHDNAENWAGIALYSVDGDARNLRVTPQLPVYKTAAGEKCPYITNELLPQFGAQWLRVLFYRLDAGTQIAEHRDIGTNRRILGITRIHVPVITNDNVLMYVGGKPYHFDVGTAWYFDASARHKVENNSTQDRIHLVIDLKSCDELDALLKPDTVKDQLRYRSLAMLYHLGLDQKFCTLEKCLRYMGSREGRTRIYAKMKQIFPGNPRLN